MRIGFLWCASLVAAGAAQAQQPTSQTEPLFRTTTRTVEVSVVATWSNGSAVRDLTKDELRLFDDSREQTIRMFDKVQNGRSDARRGPGARRLSILLLDALNTSWSDQIYARRAAAGALEQIQAGDRVAIFVLMGNGLRLLHDFSSDYASLKALVTRFSGETPRGGSDPPATSYSAEFSYSDLLQSNKPTSGPWAIIRQRQNILDTLDSLTAIARLVKGAPGQKSLLWLSAGFPLQIEERGGYGGTLGSESFHNEAAQTMRELNAANVSLYPVDARGLAMSSRAYINIATMQELAAQTGGKAYYNSNGLTSMVRAALDDSRDSYVLTYAPSDIQDDGRFHSIRLRTSRRGVQLRYRPGYYADARKAAKR
jgi:VWFA-related protein